jgi:hypothetical protein
MARLKPEISQSASMLGRQSAHRRLGHLSASERSEAMRKVRTARILKIAQKLKKDRPRANDNWAVGNAAFLNANKEARARDKSFRNANDSFGSRE